MRGTSVKLTFLFPGWMASAEVSDRQRHTQMVIQFPSCFHCRLGEKISIVCTFMVYVICLAYLLRGVLDSIHQRASYGANAIFISSFQLLV
ncbi:uncharacterized protein FA14DRAFT_74231 [Meira miltonrushii]|uniref:Uncharacterized protein n=1 Tax=Meira miltonrushii TaxID=1280837 RepID=A0A316V4I0_9BASI|nr:uncharacterized protein FA14DRAFT_74231 [Meira miltonrushii]PWN32457.1 hypothetical protein FA14DRAFT_74231 [Meira miltonrushii]